MKLLNYLKLFSKKYYKTLALSVIISSFIFYILSCNFLLFKVYGSSMENTLHSNDFLLVSLNSYKDNSPNYNDIVNIKYTNNSSEKYIVKRIIGTPGDTIKIINNTIFLNGELLEESYVKNSKNSIFNIEITIPQDKYFVLGDNRDVSYDSRYFGLIDKLSIQGKVLLKFCTLDKLFINLGS
ncbi:MAG: signal peptidase I [Clostridium perfringens]|nr:signal peptidase I [Clostridium perfringens]